MSKKGQCKRIMEEWFGPATARRLDALSEEEVVEWCKDKVTLLLGAEKAKIFDRIK